MDSIGIDLYKRDSQLCIFTDNRELIERRIVISRERLTAVLGDRPAARVLLEAPTESEWFARHLESLRHTVIVADPRLRGDVHALQAREDGQARRPQAVRGAAVGREHSAEAANQVRPLIDRRDD